MRQWHPQTITHIVMQGDENKSNHRYLLPLHEETEYQQTTSNADNPAAISIPSVILQIEEDEEEDEYKAEENRSLVAAISDSTSSTLSNISSSNLSSARSTKPPGLRQSRTLSTTELLSLQQVCTEDFSDDDDEDNEPSPASTTYMAYTYKLPLTSLDKLKFFVAGFCAKCHANCTCTEIIELIINFVFQEHEEDDTSFTRKLGLFHWRPHSYSTWVAMRHMFGKQRAQELWPRTELAITECISKHNLGQSGIEQDIRQSSSASHLVQCIARAVYPGENGLRFEKHKREIHEMLLYDVLREMRQLPRILSMESSQSGASYRDLSLIGMHGMSMPCFSPMGNTLWQSVEDAVSPHSPLFSPVRTNIGRALSFDTARDYGSPHSRILGNLQYGRQRSSSPEAPSSTLNQLIQSIDRFLQMPSNKDSKINLSMTKIECNDEEAKKVYDTLLKEAPYFARSILHRHSNPHYELDHEVDDDCIAHVNDAPIVNNLHTMPYIVAKHIDILNKQTFTMDIVELFSEIRMQLHYVEIEHRKSPTLLDEDEELEQAPIEPFGNNERPLSVGEFFNNYPLFVHLRKNAQNKRALDCISSTITNIVHNVLPPLSFQPWYILNDKYVDYVMYAAQISRFIRNRIHYLRGTTVSPLQCPAQLDFLIIPQSVCQIKLQHFHQVISDYDVQCSQVPFKVNEKEIGDINNLLHKSGISFKRFYLNGNPAQFLHTLVRAFDTMEKKKRHQRYIFVIDRRCPSYDGKYVIEGDPSWMDRLYMFRAPRHHEMTKQCDWFPEGFIDRTLQYLLPSSKHTGFGANEVGNGYMFALSYHLPQDNKVKTYFHCHGHGQRFSKNDCIHYWPRLFRKINGKFQSDYFDKETLEFSLADLSDFPDAAHYQPIMEYSTSK